MKAISLVALSPVAGRNSLAGPFASLAMASAIFMVILMSPNADAQVAGAIERAIAKRAAVQAANREIRSAATKHGSTAIAKRTAKGDYLVKRWNNNLVKDWDEYWTKRWDANLCNSKSPCPLPNNLGKTFKGGSYDEVILFKDTAMYRSYGGMSSPFGGEYKLGGHGVSWWKLEPSKGMAAVIDNAIPARNSGNVASKLSRIKVPAGERIYEGKSGPIYAGDGNSGQMVAVGGKTQIVIVGDASAWEIK